jgi:hypothetical protein
MDKRQKQLVDTYIRKRSIASEQSDRYARTLKELQYMKLAGYEVGKLNYPEYTMLNPSLFDQKNFSSNMTAQLAMQVPEIMNKVDFNALHNFDRADIIIKFPEYFDKCNKGDFTMYNIRDIIISHPQLITKFSKEDIGLFNSYDIKNVILKQPSLLPYFNLSGFNSYDISDMLMDKPELITKLDVSSLSSYNVFGLLIKHPQLYPYLKHVKLNHADFIKIIKAQPSIIPLIDFTSLDNYAVTEAIKAVPSIINYIDPEKSESMRYLFVSTLVTNPEILKEPKAKKFLTIFDSNDIKYLIDNIPKYLDYFDLNKLESWDIKSLIIKSPKIIKNKAFKNILSKLNRWDIIDILNQRPELEPIFSKQQNK